MVTKKNNSYLPIEDYGVIGNLQTIVLVSTYGSPVNEQVEALSLIGDVTLYGDESKLHAPVVVSKSHGKTMGGLLLKITVHPALELIFEESPAICSGELTKKPGSLWLIFLEKG